MNRRLFELAGLGDTRRLVNVFRIGIPDRSPRKIHFREEVERLIV
jgi:hypothetical protein